jgi:phosphoribosylanthranilate isomerase
VAEFAAPSYIKICGVTRLEEVEDVIAAGADGLGLILAQSPREVSLEAARVLADAARGRVLVSAVFRGRGDDFILEAANALDVDVVQVHGPLSAALLEGLRSCDRLIVKTLSIDSDEFLDFDDALVDAVLIDGPTPGSGRTHSWDRLAGRQFRARVIAAGGLAPSNVADTVRRTGVWGVDVASGVESALRVKDPTLVRQFVENARRALEERAVT